MQRKRGEDPLRTRLASNHVLDLTGAAISSLDGAAAESGGESAVLSKRESVPSISLPRQCTHVRHFAMGAFRIQQSTFRLVSDSCFRGMIDMGGSLVKLVYFSPDVEDSLSFSALRPPVLGGGRLHFRKFEASKMEQCLSFIEQKRLHLGAEGGKAVVKATGGGAYKYEHFFFSLLTSVDLSSLMIILANNSNLTMFLPQEFEDFS